MKLFSGITSHSEQFHLFWQVGDQQGMLTSLQLQLHWNSQAVAEVKMWL